MRPIVLLQPNEQDWGLRLDILNSAKIFCFESIVLDIGRPVLCRAQTHSVYLFHITADACRYKTDCFDLFSLNVNHDFDKLDIKTLFLFKKFLSD